MKFRIHLSANKEPVPFDYPYQLCGIFHHWLGPNDLHAMLSLYSLGWLQGHSKVNDGKLYFPDGAAWDIGIYQNEIAERLVRGLLLKEFEFYGMKIRKATRLDFPINGAGTHRFLAGSPVMLRRVEDDGTRTHITYKDPGSDHILNRIIHKKAEEADFEPAKSLRITFDTAYGNPKTKLVDIKGIKNRASVCPVIAEGSAEALTFLWEVGAGEMTGVGFGSLNHTAEYGNSS